MDDLCHVRWIFYFYLKALKQILSPHLVTSEPFHCQLSIGAQMVVIINHSHSLIVRFSPVTVYLMRILFLFLLVFAHYVEFNRHCLWIERFHKILFMFPMFNLGRSGLIYCSEGKRKLLFVESFSLLGR